jgi:hypothetical protein
VLNSMQFGGFSHGQHYHHNSWQRPGYQGGGRGGGYQGGGRGAGGPPYRGTFIGNPARGRGREDRGAGGRGHPGGKYSGPQGRGRY